MGIALRAEDSDRRLRRQRPKGHSRCERRLPKLSRTCSRAGRSSCWRSSSASTRKFGDRGTQPARARSTFSRCRRIFIVDNILHLSIVPARISREIVEEAEQLAVRIAEALNVVGLIAVEMFSPRTASCMSMSWRRARITPAIIRWRRAALRSSSSTSARSAICRLTSTELLTPVVMVNVLGEHMEPLMAWLAAGGEAELEREYRDHGESSSVRQSGGEAEAQDGACEFVNAGCGTRARLDRTIDNLELTGCGLSKRKEEN